MRHTLLHAMVQHKNQCHDPHNSAYENDKVKGKYDSIN